MVISEPCTLTPHPVGIAVSDLETATDLTASREQLAARGYTCPQDGSIRGLVDFSYCNAKELGCIVEPLQLSCDLVTFILQNAQPYVHKSI